MIISTELATLEGFHDEFVKIARAGGLGRVARRGGELLLGGSKTTAKGRSKPGKIREFLRMKGKKVSIEDAGARPGNLGIAGLKDKATRNEAAKSWAARGAVGAAVGVGAAKAGKSHRKTEKRQLGRAYVAGARDMYSRVRRG